MQSAIQAGYQKFQAALLEGRLRPGQLVSQKELGAMLNLSVGALREILPRLQSEGLLNVQPKRGILIPAIDLQMIRNAFQMRAALEREAVLHAVRKMSDEELLQQRKSHEDVLEELARSEGRDVPVQGQKIDEGLHLALIDGTGNALLQHAYDINNIRIRLINVDRLRLTRATMPEAFTDHLAVIEAILMRDADKAVKAMDAHIVNARNRAMEF